MKLFGMPVSFYLRALLTGRIGHWASTNDLVLNEAATRVEEVGGNLTPVLRAFLVASDSVAQQLVGYQHSIRVLAVTQRSLSPGDFRCLYSALLAYFVVMFYTLNPFLRTPLILLLPRVAPSPSLVEEYVRNADRERAEYGDNLASFLGTSYTERLATLAWQHLARDFPGVRSGDSAGLISFKIIVSQAAIGAIDYINALP